VIKALEMIAMMLGISFLVAIIYGISDILEKSKIGGFIKDLIMVILFYGGILLSIGYILYEVYSFCVEIHYMINGQG
jgi:hypothetical protein